VSRIINARSIDIADFKKKIEPPRLVRLLVLNWEGEVSTATAKSMLEEMFNSGKDADTLIAEQGLGQISDSGEIDKIAGEVIAANPDAVADYKAGKTQSLKFLVGQVMRATRGRANPGLAGEVLKKKLEEG
ncbi:MAG TPA: Asp-tRNA(Asn)/Glu-tRNA(Gln) amidotransferase GatCAB subunit B, partial [Dehalococcoidia bacterium]|nr:Asp-tRNA(Asn)/Glu-tRNA(Gln) amidotransferase GatCAB subunit B [Dehalococcoidia bacterium]